MTRLVMNGRAPDLSTIPDVLLPVQIPHVHRALPSQNLMLAVLEDAVGEYRRLGRGSGRRATRLFGELTTWFESDDRAWTFSFQNICHTLGLEAGPIRAELRTWPRPQPKRRRPMLCVASPIPAVAPAPAVLLAKAG